MFCRKFRSAFFSDNRFRVVPAALHKNLRSSVVALFLLFAVVFGTSPARAGSDQPAAELKRAKLLEYMVRQDLQALHFSHRKIDAAVAKETLDLFLKQLDFQKRFLLKKDVEKLQSYAVPAEGAPLSGGIQMADSGFQILAKRIRQAEAFVKESLSRDFDFSMQDSIETDSEKLDYCKTDDELKQRWEKILKLQVLTQYLTLVDEGALNKNAPKKESSQKDLMAKARERVGKNYEAFFARTLQEKEREHFDRYFSALARAFDPHTDYMPETNKEDFDIAMRGSLEGIGATLKEEDSYIKVVSVTPGGPAYRQGQLQPEDVIIKVAEKEKEPIDLTDMRVSDAVKYIRGKKGTEVVLTVKKPDSSMVAIPIIRDVVQLEDTFAKAVTLKDDKGNRKFGYLKIPGFYRDFERTRNGGTGRNVTDDVKRELAKIEKDNIDGLIIDLRNNGGGALTDAIKIATLFVGNGPVVQVKDNDGKITVLRDDSDEGIMYNGPIIVLINKLSASASEILAGALQDYGRAVVIGGEHTHGKGTVQSMISLSDGIPFSNEEYKTLGSLRLTIQKFYRVNGESTQFKGVVPDVHVPDLLDHLKTGEKYLDFPLPWDTIASTSFKQWRTCRPDLGKIRDESKERVAKNKEFKEIEAENKKAMERQGRTVQSLNLSEVRKEREEDKEFREKSGEFSHGEPSGKKASMAKMTDAERNELWTKEVGKDPYVKEGISVLDDMITADPTCKAPNTWSISAQNLAKPAALPLD